MPEGHHQTVSIACEGMLDGTVISVLATAHNLQTGAVYDMGGKHRLDARLGGYVNAARFTPWIVQRDLDTDAPCGPELARRLVPNAPANLCFIVAVHQVEAWLLADRLAIAAHLRIAEGIVPDSPEALDDAKGVLVGLARRSRSREIRDDIVPDPKSGRRVGRGYTSRLQSFVQQDWNFRRAASVAPSLATLTARMRRFEQTGTWR